MFCADLYKLAFRTNLRSCDTLSQGRSCLHSEGANHVERDGDSLRVGRVHLGLRDPLLRVARWVRRLRESSAECEYSRNCDFRWFTQTFFADPDDCAANLCSNGGCVDGIGAYTCQCNRGYDGTFCDSESGMSAKVLSILSIQKNTLQSDF